MLMVIFGAGASYDSALQVPGDQRDVDGLPLTKGLFDARPWFDAAAKQYGTCKPLVGPLRDLAARGESLLLEDELAKIAASSEGNPETLRQLLALRFYVRQAIADQTDHWLDVTGGFTNYGRLLRRVGDWRAATNEQVVLVTFNYDLMLDSALAEQMALGLVFRQPADYVARDDWKLCKLHGSTDWSRTVRIHDPRWDVDWATAVIAAADQLELGQGEVSRTPIVPEHRVAHGASVIDVTIPALALPVSGKSTFETHPSHVQAFDAAVPQVDRLLIIGWRGMEDHVLERLRMTPHYSLGIADPSAKQVYTQLESAFIHDLGHGRNRNAGNSAVRAVSFKSFSQLVSGDAVDKWLRIPLPTNSFANTHLMPWEDYERQILPVDLAASG